MVVVVVVPSGSIGLDALPVRGGTVGALDFVNSALRSSLARIRYVRQATRASRRSYQYFKSIYSINR